LKIKENVLFTLFGIFAPLIHTFCPSYSQIGATYSQIGATYSQIGATYSQSRQKIFLYINNLYHQIKVKKVHIINIIIIIIKKKILLSNTENRI
jgi:hypothetical protein